jgi:hypothetical protein
MSRLCRLRSSSHGEDGKWAYEEILRLRRFVTDLSAHRDDLLASDQKWINPNDKTQERYLPEIGSPVLFAHGNSVYYGFHTGGSFRTGIGVTARDFVTWNCRWMQIPEAPPMEVVK